MRYSIDIDLDEALVERLETEASTRGRTVGELISLLLSRAATDLDVKASVKPRFTVRAKALHAYPEVDFSSTSRLLESLGEERYPR